MTRLQTCCVALAAWAALAALATSNQAQEESFRPLFNGKDLTGWVNVNCGPGTWQVRDGLLIASGEPNGFLRSDRMYENFVLELEWMHLVPKGNSGLFVWSDALPARGSPFSRSHEIQIMDGVEAENYTSHGDVFSIQGATMKPDRPHPNGWMRCLPSEKRCKPAGEWNHYRVVCNDGVIKLSVNGKEVAGAFECRPRKGYICLESEGSEIHFRNVRIRELPSTNPKPEEIAEEDQGFVALYNGADFTNWKWDPRHEGHWRVRNYILGYDGQSPAGDLWSDKSYRDFVLICDWRWAQDGKPTMRPVILPSGDYAVDDNGQQKMVEVLEAGDSGIYLRGSSKSQVNMWCWPAGSGEVYGYRTDASMPPEVRQGVTPKKNADRPIRQWNRFVITMKGDRLTVVLNGETVIENAQLPGVAREGPIALQHHGDPIHFSNIFIKPLE